MSYPSSGLVGPQFSLTVDETSHVAPAVSLSVPSQQFPFVYTTTTVTADVLEEFSAPVYDQVHQEHFAASEMTVDFVEIPVVHEQVIVGLPPERLVDARGPQGGWSVRHARALKPPSSLPSSWCKRRHMTTLLLRSS